MTKIALMEGLGLAALSHVTAQGHHVTGSLANACVPLERLENIVKKSVQRVAGVLDVRNGVRRVRTQAAVTLMTAHVSALLDSSADCARTCVPRDASVWAVSSDVPVIMEDAAIM